MGTKRKIVKAASADYPSITEAFEEFYQAKEAHNLSPATLRNYKLSFRLFMEFNEFTDETTTEEITTSHIYHWINSQKLDGVKHTSINHYLRDIRTFLYWCMDGAREYTKQFKIEMIKGQEEQIKLFSDEDIEALLEKPRFKDSFVDFRTWVIVNWVLATGNRASTICEVKIGDLDFKNKEITLRHTKNKKAQTVPMSSALESVLKEYIRLWRKGVSDDYWLFPNIGEDKLTTNALRLSFTKYCSDRQVKRHNIHGLRHNFAKYYLQSNGNMFKLQKILGHSSLDMTRKYVKLFTDDIKDDYDKFSPLDTIKKASRRTQTIKRSDY